MARFNEILVGRYNRALQKLFGIKGDAPVPILASEIMPSWSLFAGIENRYLESWYRYGCGIDIPAGAAGKNGQVRLRNPTGSNVIAVVEKVTMNPTAVLTMAVQIGQPSTDLGTLQAGSMKQLDGRQTNAASNLILSSDNTITGAGQIGGDIWASQVASGVLGADLIMEENQEIPITPGWCMAIVAKTAATEIQVSIWWRERFLEESERT